MFVCFIRVVTSHFNFWSFSMNAQRLGLRHVIMNHFCFQQLVVLLKLRDVIIEHDIDFEFI